MPKAVWTPWPRPLGTSEPTSGDKPVWVCSADIRNMKFPNDENGNILAKMFERGDDLSKSRKIDFCFVFPEDSKRINLLSKRD